MDRQAFVDQVKARLESWNAQIDKLEEQARQAEAESRARIQDQLEDLRRQRDRAEEKLQDMRTVSDRAWRDMGKGFEDAWGAIEDSFHRAAKRFD